MNTVERVAKNATALYIAYIVTYLLSILLIVCITRKLGDVTFGKYAFALAFTAIFAIFLDLGFGMLMVREMAKDRSAASKYLGNFIIITAILSVVVFSLIALVINLMDYPQDTTTAVLLFGVYAIFSSFADLFRMTFRAFERMEYESAVSIIEHITIVSLGLIALFLGYGLIELAYVFVIGSGVRLILSFLICRKRFATPKLEIDVDFWKTAIKTALPIAFLGIATLVYVRIDTVMLSVMKGDAVVGWYNAAYNLVLGLRPMPQIFLIALFPLMARFSISNPTLLKTTYQRAFNYMLIIGLPIAAGMTLIADKLIPFLYGEQFSHSTVALQILAWDGFLFFVTRPLAVLLVSINRQNQMAAIAGTCVLVNIVLNLLLIPPLSYVGAGIATVVTELLLFTYYFYLASKYLYRLPLHSIAVRPLIACLVMSLFVYNFSQLNLFLLIALSAVLYFGVLYLIKGFSRDDINLVKATIKVPRTARKDSQGQDY